MDRGRVLRNCGFDELQEEYVRVQVSAVDGELPVTLPFRDVLSCERDARQALVVMKNPADNPAEFGTRYGLRVTVVPLAFEDVYRLVVESGRREWAVTR